MIICGYLFKLAPFQFFPGVQRRPARPVREHDSLVWHSKQWLYSIIFLVKFQQIFATASDKLLLVVGGHYCDKTVRISMNTQLSSAVQVAVKDWI